MKSQHWIGTKTPKQDQMTDTQDNVTDNHTIRGPCQIQIQMQIQIYTCKYKWKYTNNFIYDTNTVSQYWWYPQYYYQSLILCISVWK